MSPLLKAILISLALSLSTMAFAVDRIVVPAGSFQMGCSKTDTKCEKDEGGPGGMSVNVAAFKMDKNEVTVAEYKEVYGSGTVSTPQRP